VKLFAAMLHQEKVVIAQHAIPEDTNEITQVRQLLDPVGLDGAVVTGDAAHAQRETAAYLAGPEDEGGLGADYFLFVQGQPARRAARGLRPDRCAKWAKHSELWPGRRQGARGGWPMGLVNSGGYSSGAVGSARWTRAPREDGRNG
jgi:hypothetical protein